VPSRNTTQMKPHSVDGNGIGSKMDPNHHFYNLKINTGIFVWVYF